MTYNVFSGTLNPTLLCIPDIYVIIVLILYFFLEPALMG